mgnify:FL=1
MLRRAKDLALQTLRGARAVLFGPSPASPVVTVGDVVLQADTEASKHYFDFHATGAVVWPATHALCDYLISRPHMQAQLQGARVIELGAGHGLAGLAAAALGARSVCLTDRLVPRLTRDPAQPVVKSEVQLDTLRRTAKENELALPHCILDVEELAFGDTSHAERVLQSHGPFDVVLGSDVSFYGPYIPLLVRSLVTLCSESSTVVLAHARRRAALEEMLVQELEAYDFEVAVAQAHDDSIAIVECSLRRPASV